jgi:hypothetical protein
MNGWVRVTDNDLQAHMMPAQLLLLRTVAPVVPGGEDPLFALRHEVVTKIRAAIRNGKVGILSCDEEKIPAELLSDACALILEALHMRIAAIRLNPDQVRAVECANNMLLRVERGEFCVSRPDDPAYHISGGSSLMICLHRRFPRVSAVALIGL